MPRESEGGRHVRDHVQVITVGVYAIHDRFGSESTFRHPSLDVLFGLSPHATPVRLACLGTWRS